MAASPSPRERERYRREFGILQRLRDVRGVPKANAYAHAAREAYLQWGALGKVQHLDAQGPGQGATATLELPLT